MFVDTGQRFGSLGGTCRRARAAVWGAGLAAVLAAWLLAAVPASAQPGPSANRAIMYTHSAKSGELKGRRLILRGVGRRVTWAHNGGRSGTVSIKRLHRGLFPLGKPATGTLHVAGQRGGDEPTFRLSKPRYYPARRTVSYRAKPLNNKPLPRQAARGAGILRAGKFGAASLSIVPAPPLSAGGNTCNTIITNNTGYTLDYVDNSEGKWPTDDWQEQPNQDSPIPSGSDGQWISVGGASRGCANSAVFQIQDDPGGKFNLSTEWDWGWNGPQANCSSADSRFVCRNTSQNGQLSWSLEPAS
jgi:hypothetical protein